MAGSLQYFIYELDDGASSVKLRLDESNTRAVGGTPAGNTAATGLPAGVVRFEPRYILAQLPSGARRKITVLTPDATLYQQGGTLQLRNYETGALETAVVTGTVGEKKTFAAAFDTGLTDGTPDAAAGP